MAEPHKQRGVLGGLTASTLALALGACSFAPAYHPPVVESQPPVAFKEQGPWVPAVPAKAGDAGDWWEAFGDVRLDLLEDEAVAGNPGLAVSLSRYEQARAALGKARAALMPNLDAEADITNNRQSADRPLRGGSQPDYYAADTVGLGASYELDLWGRVRNMVAAGKAEATASAEDLAAARLSLRAQLAADYINLRGLDQQAALLTSTVKAYADADEITRQRFTKGIADGIDTGRSGAQLADAQAQLADVQNARAMMEHAIAALVGHDASTFTLPADTTPLAPVALPLGVPSTLLQRRPDVAAAERRMYEANRNIGVAKAAFFPQIGLAAMGGYQGTALRGLLAAPNALWSVGPAVNFNIFDGGKRRAQLREAKAQWLEATSNYRGTVLAAFQQVEDGLSQLHHLGDEAEAQQRAALAAGQAARLSTNRYEKGASAYLDVVTAQTAELTAKRSALAAQTRHLVASVDLVRALGGTWNPKMPLADQVRGTNDAQPPVSPIPAGG